VRRRIARDLGIHRETVARYLNLAIEREQKESKPAKVITGSERSLSKCEGYRNLIKEQAERGLSAQRIWQDLRDDYGFDGGYQSVQRFVRKLSNTRSLPFRRMECDPSEEAQVDFGTGAFVTQPNGKRRRPYLFRIVLSYSRKAYSEAVYRQTTEAFIRSIENAFWHWGGVPKILVIDNLRAAVKKADWFDPEINPKVEAFCRHYGTLIMPTKPYTPRHKGKVESEVDYAQNNALKGRTFESLTNENRHLSEWEDRIAGTRIHGTTRRQVNAVFEAEEIQALQPLPRDRFPFYNESKRSVHRDGHIEVEKAYYSVPPEYMSRKVWVRWDGRILCVFNYREEKIATHCMREAGRFSTDPAHIASEKRSAVELGAAKLVAQANQIGTQTGSWATAVAEERGVQGIRVIVGLPSLSRKSSASHIETACGIARIHGAYHLRIVRELIKRQEKKEKPLEFLGRHEIIRSLSIYQEMVDAQTYTEEEVK
jgi:transposase